MSTYEIWKKSRISSRYTSKKDGETLCPDGSYSEAMRPIFEQIAGADKFIELEPNFDVRQEMDGKQLKAQS